MNPSKSCSACIGLTVSTSPDRGDIHTRDFPSHAEAVQRAYDRLATTPGSPQTLILDPSGGPFQMDAPLEIWQSCTRVTSTGGVCMVPTDNYRGPLIQTHFREGQSKPGDDGLIYNVVMDHLHLDGQDQAQGVLLRHLQLSNLHDLHICNTNGPALWLSDFCIENLFSTLILSDNCGNADYPVILIQPEILGWKPEGQDAGNITVNSTQFNGVMVHFPRNDVLRISAEECPVGKSRRHRKIQFNGCFFHGHDRLEGPLVTLSGCFELAFLGCQMLRWNSDGTIVQIGKKEDKFPVGTLLWSHCHFLSRPAADAPEGNLTSKAFEVVHPDVGEGAAVLSAFGNDFGSDDARLGHAVDWGNFPGLRAAWAANLVNTAGPAFLGTAPTNADQSPFAC